MDKNKIKEIRIKKIIGENLELETDNTGLALPFDPVPASSSFSWSGVTPEILMQAFGGTVEGEKEAAVWIAPIPVQQSEPSNIWVLLEIQPLCLVFENTSTNVLLQMKLSDSAREKYLAVAALGVGAQVEINIKFKDSEND